MDSITAREQFQSFLADLATRTARINYDSEFDTLYVFAPHALPPEFREQPRMYQVAPGTMIEILRSTGTAYGIEVQGFGRSLEEYDTPRDLRAWWYQVRRDGRSEVDGHRLSDALAHGTFAH